LNGEILSADNSTIALFTISIEDRTFNNSFTYNLAILPVCCRLRALYQKNAEEVKQS